MNILLYCSGVWGTEAVWEDVFPLSMNYMDRMLLVFTIKKTQLQLLGATSMLIASELKESLPLTGHIQVSYGKFN